MNSARSFFCRHVGEPAELRRRRHVRSVSGGIQRNVIAGKAAACLGGEVLGLACADLLHLSAIFRKGKPIPIAVAAQPERYHSAVARHSLFHRTERTDAPPQDDAVHTVTHGPAIS